MANPLYQKHIISINDLSRDDLNLVLATAAKLKANPQPELLKHKVIASCFFEASTRTRLSSPTAPIHHWVKRAKRWPIPFRLSALTLMR